jgi:hypothetical protein
MATMLTPDTLRPLIRRELNSFHGIDDNGNTTDSSAPGRRIWSSLFGGSAGRNNMGKNPFASLFGSRDNTAEHAYGKLAASTTQNVAAAGAFVTPNFTLQKAVTDAVLYLSDDGKQVQDITAVTFGGETYTLSGALAGSAFRDDASLGGPNKGLYLGDVDTSQIVSISGNVKAVPGAAAFTAAIFSFYVVGKFKGKGCSCSYGNQP